MKQPTKDILREQLALAADRIMELEADNAALREGPVWRWVMEIPDCKPWWKRLWDKCKAACEGDRGWA